MYKGLRRFCAVTIGIVFFMAGTLKLMDPTGAMLVVDEYLKFMHLGFLKFASGFFGVAMALTETLLGAALITGIWRKITAAATGLVMLFFTILTLILLIANPSMDCGCFGEAIHLTHAQSFVKNLVLDAMWLVAFVPFKKSGAPKKIKYATFAIAAISSCVFLIWSLRHLPAIDFTPYAPGAEVTGNPVLSFADEDGNYYDELATEGDVMVISIYDNSKISLSQWNAIAETAAELESAGITPIVICEGKVPENASSALESCYCSDFRTLIALNRSNGGATLLHDGMVMRKWTAQEYPDVESII